MASPENSSESISQSWWSQISFWPDSKQSTSEAAFAPENGKNADKLPFSNYPGFHGDNLMQDLTEQDKWRNFVPAEQPWARFRRAWRLKNEHGFPPMEVFISQWTAGLTGSAGFLFGGTLRHREMIERFSSHNAKSVYFDQLQANMRMIDFTMAMYLKHGFQMAGKWIFLSVGTLFPVLSMSAYRNRFELWYFPCASAASGALYKLHLGPRAMLVSGGLAAVFISTFICLPASLLCYYSGVRANDVYHDCLQDYHWEQMLVYRISSKYPPG